MKAIKKEREEVQRYLDNLTQDDVLVIIKYGLRGSDAPESVTVADIFYWIQCNPYVE